MAKGSKPLKRAKVSVPIKYFGVSVPIHTVTALRLHGEGPLPLKVRQGVMAFGKDTHGLDRLKMRTLKRPLKYTLRDADGNMRISTVPEGTEVIHREVFDCRLDKVRRGTIPILEAIHHPTTGELITLKPFRLPKMGKSALPMDIRESLFIQGNPPSRKHIDDAIALKKLEDVRLKAMDEIGRGEQLPKTREGRLQMVRSSEGRPQVLLGTDDVMEMVDHDDPVLKETVERIRKRSPEFDVKEGGRVFLRTRHSFDGKNWIAFRSIYGKDGKILAIEKVEPKLEEKTSKRADEWIDIF